MSLLRKALAHENSLPPVDLGTSRTLYYRHENALCMRRILTKIGAGTGQANLVSPLCLWFLLTLQTLAKARLFILSALTVKNITKHTQDKNPSFNPKFLFKHLWTLPQGASLSSSIPTDSACTYPSSPFSTASWGTPWKPRQRG